MAAPLRYPLILLAWGIMALIYLPVFPAIALMLAPAFRLACWQALFADPQIWQALAATLISTLLSVGGALLISLTLVAALWPSRGWRQLAGRLPLLLAVPHVAFATGALLPFRRRRLAVSRLFRLLPAGRSLRHWSGADDGHQRERIFAVGDLRSSERKTPGRAGYGLKSQGYGRWQCLNWLILPTLLPSLAIVLVATTAWSLSTVDVALVIGPGNPPTLAVLAWQWLNQGDDMQQAKGALASLLLLLILGGVLVCAWGGWRLWQRQIPDLQAFVVRSRARSPDGCWQSACR